jgi:hypothetical protein
VVGECIAMDVVCSRAYGDERPRPGETPPPTDAPCTHWLRHGDPMHAQERLTAAATVVVLEDGLAGVDLVDHAQQLRQPHLRVHWVAVPKPVRARRVNRRPHLLGVLGRHVAVAYS